MPKHLLLKTTSVVGAILLGIVLGRLVASHADEPKPQKRQPTPSKKTQRRETRDNAAAKPFTVMGGFENRIQFRGHEPGRQSVSPKPGVLVVDAESSIKNYLDTQKFRWFLSVGIPTRPPKTIHEFTYDHQSFTIPRDAVVTPAFHEELPLPPGRYIVALKLQSSTDIRKPDGSIDIPKFPIASEVFVQTVP